MTGEARGISPKRSVRFFFHARVFYSWPEMMRHARRRSPRLSPPLHTPTHHSAQVCESLDVGELQLC